MGRRPIQRSELRCAVCFRARDQGMHLVVGQFGAQQFIGVVGSFVDVALALRRYGAPRSRDVVVTDGQQFGNVNFQALGQLQECLESRRELIVLHL